MQGKYRRYFTDTVQRKLRNNPFVAILGPRQCGKTTLALQIINELETASYLDLENPADLAKLSDPLAYFGLHTHELVCLDEIQRVPEIFTVLRSIVDNRERNSQFLILGSASPDLIRQTSETLAGRISYFDLTPFILPEVEASSRDNLRKLWLRGGFP